MGKKDSVKDIAEHLDKYSTVYGEVLLGIHNDLEHQEQRLISFEKRLDTEEQDSAKMQNEIARLHTDIENLKALVEDSARSIEAQSKRVNRVWGALIIGIILTTTVAIGIG